ncbi:MAG: LysR family transcriptional regulator, partial [Moraxella sp.]|nr:LysR family transcriptional regulator [Moraxella sp.]
QISGSIYGYLTVFHAIATEGSIAAAARKLQIASPSISKSLKLLEQHIGLPLFRRTTRKVELTEAGQRLFERSQAAMTQLSFAVESVHDLGQTPSGKVRITVPRIAYLLVLKPHFAEFCRRYPEIELEISVFDGTVDILKEGFDLGIRFGHSVGDNMIARRLTPAFKMGVYASKEYVVRFGLPKKLEDLPKHRLIAFRYMTSGRLNPMTLVQDGQDVTIDMPTAMIANSLEVVLDGVRAGVGLGRVFEPILTLENDAHNFVPVLQKHWQTFPPLSLYYLPHSQKARRVAVVIEFLMGVIDK